MNNQCIVSLTLKLFQLNYATNKGQPQDHQNHKESKIHQFTLKLNKTDKKKLKNPSENGNFNRKALKSQKLKNHKI